MPFYDRLDCATPEGRRTAQGLLRLKEQIDKDGLLKRSSPDSLMLATWNIREFGRRRRSDEALYYLAEIISCFDLVAVQELRDDLRSFRRLMRLLGGWWKFLLTDVTEGRRGNRERLCFLYDSRKISFGGLAGEVVIPPAQNGKTYTPEEQLARTPYVAGFRAGWFHFTLCTAHILYGKNQADHPERVKEIEVLARTLSERVKERHAWSRSVILLGDFNIFRKDDAGYRALTEPGFQLPTSLDGLERDKQYDQIAFLAPQVQDQLELCRSGVFRFFDSVYRDTPTDRQEYEEAWRQARRPDDTEEARELNYLLWRTYEMSDHFPLWTELKVDFSVPYLRQKLDKAEGPRTLSGVAAELED